MDHSFFQKRSVSILLLGLPTLLAGIFVPLLIAVILKDKFEPPYLLLMALVVFGYVGAFRSLRTPILRITPHEIHFRQGPFIVRSVSRPSIALEAEPARKWGTPGVLIKGTESWVPAAFPRGGTLPGYSLDGARTLWIPFPDLREDDRSRAEGALIEWVRGNV